MALGFVALMLAACSADLSSMSTYPDVRILSDVLTPTTSAPSVIDLPWQRTEVFEVRVPAGWQAETLPAQAEAGAIFRAGPCTTLTVALRPYATRFPKDCKGTPLHFMLRGRLVNGQMVLIMAMSPMDDWAEIAPVYAALIESVRAP